MTSSKTKAANVLGLLGSAVGNKNCAQLAMSYVPELCWICHEYCNDDDHQADEQDTTTGTVCCDDCEPSAFVNCARLWNLDESRMVLELLNYTGKPDEIAISFFQAINQRRCTNLRPPVLVDNRFLIVTLPSVPVSTWDGDKLGSIHIECVNHGHLLNGQPLTHISRHKQVIEKLNAVTGDRRNFFETAELEYLQRPDFSDPVLQTASIHVFAVRELYNDAETDQYVLGGLAHWRIREAKKQHTHREVVRFLRQSYVRSLYGDGDSDPDNRWSDVDGESSSDRETLEDDKYERYWKVFD